jgi:CheY-like chemotaxis protein
MKSKKVLVVDDDAINRKVMSALLKKMGLSVELAENGQQAFDMITSKVNLPDAVLMDVQMPIMDGNTAVKRIREWESENQQPHLTVLALTGNVFKEDFQKCMDSGMDDVLTKPVSVSILNEKLGQRLSQMRHQTQHFI